MKNNPVLKNRITSLQNLDIFTFIEGNIVHYILYAKEYMKEKKNLFISPNKLTGQLLIKTQQILLLKC